VIESSTEALGPQEHRQTTLLGPLDMLDISDHHFDSFEKVAGFDCPAL
jgi:hypothetical protein